MISFAFAAIVMLQPTVGTPSVRDSAGVRIHTVRTPAIKGRAVIRVDTAPMASFARPATGQGFQAFRTTAAHLVGKNNVVVVWRMVFHSPSCSRIVWPQTGRPSVE